MTSSEIRIEPVRVGLVGLGHLGSFHLQKIVADEMATLAGVVEINVERREKVAREHGVLGVERISQLAGRAEAVVIAAPTSIHIELIEEALTAGFHVLVEKPVATASAAARQLQSLAEKHQRVVQVGHTERFNPAIEAALRVADSPRYVVAERLGPFTGRSTDVDVVLDLMIHDLDIVASLVASPLAEVRAIGVPIITHDVDMAAARLQFEDGAVAQLSAGRASLEPTRKIRLFTPQRYISIDCMNREVKSVRRDLPADGRSWPVLSGEPVEVPEGDALARQDRSFLECVRFGRSPVVNLDAGIRALELAEAVQAALVVPLPPGQAPS